MDSRKEQILADVAARVRQTGKLLDESEVTIVAIALKTTRQAAWSRMQATADWGRMPAYLMLSFRCWLSLIFLRLHKWAKPAALALTAAAALSQR